MLSLLLSSKESITWGRNEEYFMEILNSILSCQLRLTPSDSNNRQYFKPLCLSSHSQLLCLAFMANIHLLILLSTATFVVSSKWLSEHTWITLGEVYETAHNLRLQLRTSLGCKVDYLGKPRKARLFRCSLKGKFNKQAEYTEGWQSWLLSDSRVSF